MYRNPPIQQTLLAFYDAMHARFGDRHWWPGETKLEICVGAILTQNTNWTNVEKAITNLKTADCLSITSLHAKRPAALAKLIRPAGYFNVKAKRLKNFIARVHAFGAGGLDGFLDRPVDVLRAELLSINGIGPETADSIVLYAAGLARFVVDAYTRRIFLRHGLIDEMSAGYDDIQTLCERNLPRDVALWNDYHAQLVEVGKRYCKPRPRCEGCPLDAFPHMTED